MASKLLIVGQPESPVDGQNTFTSKFLGCHHVNFMIIENVPFTPGRDFTQSLDAKSVNMGTVTFTNGNYVIFDISPIKCES